MKNFFCSMFVKTNLYFRRPSEISRNVRRDVLAWWRLPGSLPETKWSKKNLVYGIAGLAKLLGVCHSTASKIKASGVLDPAISQHGKVIVIDADLALELMKVKKDVSKRRPNWWLSQRDHTGHWACMVSFILYFRQLLKPYPLKKHKKVYLTG